MKAKNIDFKSSGSFILINVLPLHTDEEGRFCCGEKKHEDENNMIDKPM